MQMLKCSLGSLLALRIRFVGLMAAVALASACGESVAPPDGGTSAGQRVGPSGGTATFASLGITVTVPAGAVASDTEFTASQLTAAETPRVPAEFTAVGPAFRLTPEGATFAKAVSVSLAVPTGTLPSRLVMLRRPAQGGSWTPVGGAESGATGVVGWTSHFSYFVLARLLPAFEGCISRGQDAMPLTCGDSGCTGTLTVTNGITGKGLRCVPATEAAGEVVCTCQGGEGTPGSTRVTALRGAMELSLGLAIAVQTCAIGTCENPRPDGGSSDGGAPVADAGAAMDAGTPLDAGTPVVDAGTAMDAGMPVVDAGTAMDAGTPRTFLDTAFGVSGTARATLGQFLGTVRDVIVLPEGPIAVAGVAGAGSGGTDSATAYTVFSSTGSNPNNVNIVNVQSNFPDEIQTLLSPQGTQAYAVGAASSGSNLMTRFLVMRFEEGVLDTSYGSPRFPMPATPPKFGYRAVSFSQTSPRVSLGTSAFLQSTGKLVVAGVSSGPVQTDDRMRVGLARFTTTGELDGATTGLEGFPDDSKPDGFGAGKRGTVSTELPSFTSEVRVIKDATGDGFTVAAGGPTTTFVKYTAEGVVDTTFGTNGLSTVALPGRRLSKRGSALLGVGEAEGSVLVVSKFRSDFSADTTFGTNGQKTLSAYSGDRPPVMADGAGRVYIVASKGSAYVLVRLLANGDVDTTFGVAGEVALPFAPTGGSTYLVSGGLAIQADGKIVVAATVGHGENGGSIDAELVRVNP